MSVDRISHWLFQLCPPFTMLYFLSSYGPQLWIQLSLPCLCFLVSFISLISKLTNFQRSKSYLLRPVLTIMVFLLLYSLALLSYKRALHEAKIVYDEMSERCVSKDKCNINLEGWKLRDDGRYITSVGGLISYPLFFRSLDDGFHLHLYKSLDMGDNFRMKWDERSGTNYEVK